MQILARHYRWSRHTGICHISGRRKPINRHLSGGSNSLSTALLARPFIRRWVNRGSICGFAAAFGGGGAAVLPFGVGAIAQRAGVQVLQPVIVSMLALATLLWAIGMPRIKGGTEEDKLGKMTAAGKWAGRKLSRKCPTFV